MSRVPDPSEFRDPAEKIVHINTAPDGRGHQRFTVFWLTDQPWVPNGVRGQVFNADLAAFTARQSGPVRVTRDESR